MGKEGKRKPIRIGKQKQTERGIEVFKAKAVLRPSTCTACSKKAKLIELRFGLSVTYPIFLCSSCKAYLKGRLQGV